ncbi:MAG: winged helix-turn-helix domain-containing protein [Acidimicrobiaceae bacterium]|nr:winged helix-turn-helix domain-containing protein [Acidimicrobiaceae bacterium]
MLDAFVHHGPTHAGDERLLAEVGVSRSRVVQVLAELEADGLVTAQRSGRRKLYAATKGGDEARKPLEAATPSRVI